VYNNTAILDVSRRVTFSRPDYRGPNLYYPVEILAGVRPDTISDSYYKDSERDWIVYLSNQIVDPYYQWYLNDNEFLTYIQEKYGDLDIPQQKIKFWRNNWSSDDTSITPSFYNVNLPLQAKQYYSPTYGPGSKVISYQRKQVDWVTNTNRIDSYGLQEFSNNFIQGELVKIHAGDSVQDEIGGQAEVITSNSTALIVQNITGNALANSSWFKTFVGVDSGAVGVSNNFVNLSTSISTDEVIYWTSVSYYDWEVERNEAKKSIQVLNPSLAQDVSNKIRTLLNE
jgi:hypothetical protein